MTLGEKLIARGMEKGKEEGKLEGKGESLLKQLQQKFDAVSESDKKKIEDTKDLDKLDQCLVLILESESIEEILKPLD